MLEQFASDSAISMTVLALKVVLAYVALIWLALAYWTWRDVSRRTRDHFAQALFVLLTLVFFLPGYWLYLLLRPGTTINERTEEQLRRSVLTEYSAHDECVKCHKIVREDFVVCPHCLTELRPSCTRCSHAISVDWNACPYCGEVPKRQPELTPEQVTGVLVPSAQPAPA